MKRLVVLFAILLISINFGLADSPCLPGLDDLHGVEIGGHCYNCNETVPDGVCPEDYGADCFDIADYECHEVVPSCPLSSCECTRLLADFGEDDLCEEPELTIYGGLYIDECTCFYNLTSGFCEEDIAGLSCDNSFSTCTSYTGSLVSDCNDDPFDLKVYTFIGLPVGCEAPENLEIECIGLEKLPFFGWMNFIIALLLIGLIYVGINKK